jgi:hypothetical protein
MSHSEWPSERISFITTVRLRILQLSCRLSGKTSHYPGLSDLYSPDLAPCDFWLFPKAKIAFIP